MNMINTVINCHYDVSI